MVILYPIPGLSPILCLIQVKPVCVVLPRLPRDVMVEWHVIFNTDRKPLLTSSASSDDLKITCERVAAQLVSGLHYYTFYSAQTVTADELLNGKNSVSRLSQLL